MTNVLVWFVNGIVALCVAVFIYMVLVAPALYLWYGIDEKKWNNVQYRWKVTDDKPFPDARWHGKMMLDFMAATTLAASAIVLLLAGILVVGFVVTVVIGGLL